MKWYIARGKFDNNAQNIGTYWYASTNGSNTWSEKFEEATAFDSAPLSIASKFGGIVLTEEEAKAKQ